jgi:hypothetical protein
MVWALTDLMVGIEQITSFHVPTVSHIPLGDVREIGLPGILAPSVWGDMSKPGGLPADQVAAVDAHLMWTGHKQ